MLQFLMRGQSSHIAVTIVSATRQLSASSQKALQELVKAQDHLNAASDQGNEAISKLISGIVQSVRGLQRDVSNVIHVVSCGK